MLQKLPKISVITPTLNQGKYIESAIISVLDQEYPNLEYIVIDGGSTDGTQEIIKKYKHKLIFRSGKDKGQSDAINKGISISSGEIIYFLNSDDCLLPGSLHLVGRFFKTNENAFWLTGKCRVIDETGREIRKIVTAYKNIFLKYGRSRKIFSVVQFISQPSTFWRREITENTGNFDVKLKYDMDYDYWLRIWKKYPLYYLDNYLSSYRIQPEAKAVVSPETQFRVQYEIIRKYEKNKFILTLHFVHVKLALYIYRVLLLR